MMNYFNQLQIAFQKNQTSNAHFERNTIQMQNWIRPTYERDLSKPRTYITLNTNWKLSNITQIPNELQTNHVSSTNYQRTKN